MSSVSLHIANDLRLAASDLEAADALRRIDNRYDAYHLQQAVEKILLALLTSEGKHVDRKDSHRIDVLRDKLPDENPYKKRFDGLAYLTSYATAYRYPKDGGRMPERPQADDIEQDSLKIKVLLRDLAGHFGVDLTESDRHPSTISTPPR